MGTPQASASLDQMSNVQSNARRGREFADGALASSRNCSDLGSQFEKDNAVTKPVAFSC